MEFRIYFRANRHDVWTEPPTIINAPNKQAAILHAEIIRPIGTAECLIVSDSITGGPIQQYVKRYY